MSSKNERILIAPGTQAWEVWAGEPDGQLQRTAAEPVGRPGELRDLGAGETLLLFPVRDVVTMPFKVQTSDENLFGDLAKLHIERLGVRVDPLGGQLSDHFVVTTGEEQATLLAVVLTSPADGFMPSRPVGAFDFTARCLPLADGVVTVWMELGRWVFALAAGGKLVYCQATSSSSEVPDQLVATEIRLAVTQLLLQGFEVRPGGVVVWVDPGSDATGVTAELEQALRLPVTAESRPAPRWPSPASHLLPADVRAEREARRKRQQKRAALGTVAAAVVGVCAWLGWQLWSEKQELSDLQALASQLQPQADAYQLHKQKWEELSPVIQPSYWPVEIIYRVVSQIPREGGLRLTRITVASRTVNVFGEAPNSPPTAQFDVALGRSSDLAGYEWQNQPAKQGNSGAWSFQYTGSPALTPSEP
jgi:hypothetical protein